MKRSRKVRWLMMIVLVLIIGILFFVYKNQSLKNPIPEALTNFTAQNSVPIPITLDTPYINKTYGFSFKHPADFTVGEIQEETHTTFLVQKQDGSQGIQISVSSFDEAVVTKERIKQDVPDIVIEQESPIEIEGVQAGLAFISNGAGAGKSREVWFSYKGHLYQATTLIAHDSILKSILATWNFE